MLIFCSRKRVNETPLSPSLTILIRVTGTCHINAIYLRHESRGNGPETPRGHKAHEYG